MIYVSVRILSQAIDIANKNNVDIVEFNFAQFSKDSDVSQFLSFNHSQNKKDDHIEITSEISKSAKGLHVENFISESYLIRSDFQKDYIGKMQLLGILF